MSEGNYGQGEDRDLRERLDRLSSAIEKKRANAQGGDGTGDHAVIGGETGRAMAQGFRIVTELAAGVLVGCVIGWQLDKWIGTSPLFLLVFLGLGTTAGFWNMMRIGATTSATRRDEPPKQ
jgi:ATP synthase protein I